MREGILERVNWGMVKTATTAQVSIKITELRKAVYFFNQMNSEGVIIPKKDLLTREYPDKSMAKVIVTEMKPMILKYSYSREVLMLTFHYGCWNDCGVPQH